MTLTTHAIVGGACGAAVAAVSPTPLGIAGGFVLGFASHLAIDAIPHWNEGPVMLRSMRKWGPGHGQRELEIGRDFIYDLAYLGSESLLGLLVALGWFSFGFFHFSPWAICWGVVGGLLPDALHLAYYKSRNALLERFDEFHDRIQITSGQKESLYYLGTEAWTVLAALLILKIIAYCVTIPL